MMNGARTRTIVLSGAAIVVAMAPPAPTSQFGTTNLAAGAARPFTFSPHFVGWPQLARFVAADITVAESSRTLYTVAASRPRP
jgi:hypothetical protein